MIFKISSDFVIFFGSRPAGNTRPKTSRAEEVQRWRVEAKRWRTRRWRERAGGARVPAAREGRPPNKSTFPNEAISAGGTRRRAETMQGGTHAYLEGGDDAADQSARVTKT